MVTRRTVVRVGAAGAVALLGWRGLGSSLARAAVPGGTLDPTTLAKYVTALPIPRAMPRAGNGGGFASYQSPAGHFRQQFLPAGSPATTVWGYGSVTDPSSFAYPAATIEATVNRPVRVNWINGLVNRGQFRPHLLTVDPTL